MKKEKENENLSFSFLAIISEEQLVLSLMCSQSRDTQIWNTLYNATESRIVYRNVIKISKCFHPHGTCKYRRKSSRGSSPRGRVYVRLKFHFAKWRSGGSDSVYLHQVPCGEQVGVTCTYARTRLPCRYTVVRQVTVRCRNVPASNLRLSEETRRSCTSLEHRGPT